jgi:hypothetical protein
MAVMGVVGASALVAGSQGTWRAVALTLPAGVAPDAVSACLLSSGTPAIRSTPTGLEALCPATGVVRCSVPGTEPRDLDLTSLCRGDAAALSPAVRTLVPMLPARDAVTVEWRTWRDTQSTPLASRSFDPSMPAPLPVGSNERLIRIVRTGASPVTFVVKAATAGDPTELPVGVPVAGAGGEVFLALGTRERQVTSVTLAGPETRVVGVDGLPFVSVPGLAPGNYTLRFGPVDSPVGPPMSLVVRNGATTELAPQLPPSADEFRITGLVSYNGKPMVSQALEVVRSEDDTTVTTTTDAAGRYTLTVPVGGTYVVRVASTYDFGQAESQGEVVKGETTINLDVSGTGVLLTFLLNGGTPSSPVEFVLEGAERFSGIASNFSAPTELFAIPPGRYLVRASMDPAFVSPALPLEVVDGGGIRALTLDLTKQNATLRVVDASGGPVDGARARAGTQLLRSSGPGEIDISRMSPGTELIIRVRGLIPVCHVLQPNVENVVSMVGENASLEVRYDFMNLRVPPGKIRFADTDACAVPLEEFDWARISAGFEIRNLPKDTTVTYEFGDQRIPLRAPGPAVIIR